MQLRALRASATELSEDDFGTTDVSVYVGDQLILTGPDFTEVHTAFFGTATGLVIPAGESIRIREPEWDFDSAIAWTVFGELVDEEAPKQMIELTPSGDSLVDEFGTGVLEEEVPNAETIYEAPSGMGLVVTRLEVSVTSANLRPTSEIVVINPDDSEVLLSPRYTLRRSYRDGVKLAYELLNSEKGGFAYIPAGASIVVRRAITGVEEDGFVPELTADWRISGYLIDEDDL